MMTFVTTCKPFGDHFKIIQLNAIRSWLRFCPPCEVIILGRTEGVEEIAKNYGLKYIPDVPVNRYGTPLLNGLVKIGSQNASHETICLINSDIILLNINWNVLHKLTTILSKYMITARRIDLDVRELLDYTDEKTIQWLMTNIKNLHRRGNDLFIFRKGTIEEHVKPLAIGRGDHARLLIYQALKMKIPLIDATNIITLIHQKHDYSHIKYSQKTITRGIEIAFTPEGKYNETLLEYASYFGGQDCNYYISDGYLKRKTGLLSMVREMVKVPLLSEQITYILRKIRRHTPVKAKRIIREILFKLGLFY
jgi:hypothetical protein